MQRMKRFTLTVAMILIVAITYAQNIFWLQGTWRGKAYLPGSDGSQYYLLVMNISAIKGNKFEGIIATMQPTDTSYRFDSKISGVVYDKYLIISRTRILYVKDPPDIKWKVSCNNCKPPRMVFSLENGKIFFRGEEKECYKECNGVSEFSKDINEFDSSKKEAVYALVNYVPPPESAATSLANNAAPISSNNAIVQSEQNVTEQRIPVLAAGEVATTNHSNENALSRKQNTSLREDISLVIKENPAPRITILPAGNIVSTQHHNNANTLSQKETALLYKNTSLTLRENPLQRISVLPAGNIVAATQNNANVVSQKETPLMRNNTSLEIKENPLPRIAILPSGEIVSIQHRNINTSSQKESVSLTKKTSLTIEQNPSPRISILPSGNIVMRKHLTAYPIYKKLDQLRNAPSATVRQNNLVIVAKNLLSDSANLPAKTKDTMAQKIVEVHRDSIALPADYAARKKNVIRTLSVNSDTVLLRVYDNGVVDGDIVSVIYNDNVVIDKLSLTTRAVEVKIAVNPSQINTLVFHAHNLGLYPPNTAKLEILYGNKKEELTVSSDLTVSSTIDIVHQ